MTDSPKPLTEAGKRLIADDYGYEHGFTTILDAVLAIEAEAVGRAAERVAALPQYIVGAVKGTWINRADALAALQHTEEEE